MQYHRRRLLDDRVRDGNGYGQTPMITGNTLDRRPALRGRRSELGSSTWAGEPLEAKWIGKTGMNRGKQLLANPRGDRGGMVRSG